MWNYRLPADEHDRAADAPEESARRPSNLAGFGVEALDGSIGKVDAASYDAGASSIVVDTGPWIFGKKVLLPAGVVDRIDRIEEKVFVHRTRDEIKGAPEYDDALAEDESYRSQLGAYYGPDGMGYRALDDAPHPF